ncbi:ClpP/crotonase-like domain-containing protein [Zychaea mexicana]|uniref:ClpP/crotonase-like domain-containing protein n=1 Tax=Zychaea mexicana TaxID=64656 RepID=UPI0022FF2FBE|nr:ClpP/crotonase-like domain-containing protein [Zychaea mexicana]KAI9497396.1 ClpP/crotonase-like domain-containing protein [Zychaea mexicana]
MQLPSTQFLLLSIPEPHVLLITINRPKQFNALNPEANFEMSKVLDWAEDTDDIWCIIITGTGGKAFCAGMDLVNWNKDRSSGNNNQGSGETMPPTGFGGLSNRGLARKPVIAAVDGYALGGGTEMVLACNIVVATKKSKFGLPEVKRGVTIAAGGLARLARAVSYQVVSEIALTGRHITADEFKKYDLCNEVVEDGTDIVQAALGWARKIVSNSPDAVFITKFGIMLAMERASMEQSTNEWMASEEAVAWRNGENLAEGLAAFASKRAPNWKNPAPLTKKSKL